MTVKKITLIGGEYKPQVIKKMEEKFNVSIEHHDGYKAKNSTFLKLAKSSDCMVIVTQHVGHRAAEAAKMACATNLIPLAFSKQLNAEIAVRSGLELLA